MITITISAKGNGKRIIASHHLTTPLLMQAIITHVKPIYWLMKDSIVLKS